MPRTGPINVELEQLIASHPNAQALRESFNALEQANIFFADNHELYLSVIEYDYHASKLPAAFAAIEQANIPLTDDRRELYLTAIKYGFSADKISDAFKALSQANIPLTEKHKLYLVAIKYARHASKLAVTFEALNQANVSFTDNPALYFAAIECPYYIENLPIAFAALNQAKIPLADSNLELYLTAIKNLYHANLLPAAFEALKQSNIPFDDSNRELYLGAIENAKNADKLAAAFAEFNHGNILFSDENRKLYHAVIENTQNPDELPGVFSALNLANIPLADKRTLFHAVIKNARYANNLAAAFTALNQANIPFADNRELYLAVIKKAFYANKLIAAFEAVKQANIPLTGNRDLCLALIENINFVDELLVALAAFNQANIPLADNPELCLEVIKNIFFVEKLFIHVLKQDNIPFADNSELCLAFIKKLQHWDKLPTAFLTLKNAGIAYAENKSLYYSIFNSIANSEHLSEILSLMTTTGITFKQYPQFFNINTLLKYEELVISVFNKLKFSGFTMPAHPNVYSKLLEMITDGNGLSVITSALNNVCGYANEKGLCQKDNVHYERQQTALDNLLNTSIIDNLTRGPLNKSDETKQIEALLEQLSQPPIFNGTEMTYRDECYFIKLPLQEEINLSLLIKNANLSHLTLSDELIDKIGVLLMPLLNSWNETEKSNAIVGLLMPSQRAALNNYKNYTYKNINALFRSEPLDESESHWIVVTDANKDKIIHANFLLGCLVNDAANKINVLAEPVPAMSPTLIEEIEKLSSKNCILDRKEDLTPEVITRRIANPWSFPALTSFSLFKSGTKYISTTKDIHTKMDNGKGYNINQAEGEVVFPHGIQVLTIKNGNGLVSTMVCSPSLERNHYWSDLALKYALDNQLSQAYQEEQHVIQLDNVPVVRPNHGLAHTYRVMQSTELVANYFAHFAKDDEFKAFCQSLTHADQEWLRMAAAFSVTGRESEIAALDNLEKYGRYRKASADNFEKFINSTVLATETIAKETFSDVVHYMGHPDYENKINKHPNETERKRRNFFSRLLSTAHKIDLARCYDASKFSDCMQYYQDLSVQSPDQQKALNELIAYHIQVIRAHGNALHCDIKLDGTLVDTNIKYQPVFGEVSRSMKRLSEVTETVPRPLVMLPFQFPITNPPTMLVKRKPPIQYALQEENHHKRNLKGNEPSSKRQRRRVEKHEMDALMENKTNDEPKQVRRGRKSKKIHTFNK